jgi:sterol desaturase/sphingolipid hydroxylase (fatty acid hydroxylase superfamily)
MAQSSSIGPPALSSRTQARDRARARALAQIPRFYNPYVHLAATTGIGLLTLVVALLCLHHVRPIEMLIVPATFLLSNGVEWRAHKSVLHRRIWPLGILFDRHTPIHHKIYQYDSMAMRSNMEFREVLIPAPGVAAVVALSAPIACAVAWLLTPNCGWLALATSGVYVLTYELSHLSYHLPEDSFIGRRGLVRVLREHHRRHHHPALMQKWNFNVTVPIFDWLHGTMAPADLAEREAGEISSLTSSLISKQ